MRPNEIFLQKIIQSWLICTFKNLDELFTAGVTKSSLFGIQTIQIKIHLQLVTDSTPYVSEWSLKNYFSLYYLSFIIYIISYFYLLCQIETLSPGI